jgi:hypothetical protein
MPELDSHTTAGNATDSTSTSADTGALETASAETQSSAESTTPETSAAQEPAHAATPAEAGSAGSLTVGAETSAPAQPELTPEAFANLKKQYAGSTKSWQQERQQRLAFEKQAQELQAKLEQLTQQFQGADPREFQEFRDNRKPQWDSTHPKHAEFVDLVKSAQKYDQLINSAKDDATREFLIQARDADLGQDGISKLREWRADVRRQEWERQINPREYYAKMIRQEAQPVVRETLQSTSQRYQETTQAVESVKTWLSENKAIATPENLQKLEGMMQQGMPFERASMLIERDHFKAQISGADAAKRSAEEKERLLQGNAAGVIARNPNSGRFVDTKELRKQSADSRDYADKLFDLDSKGLLPPH